MRATRGTLAFAPFLDELARALRALSTDELVAVVLRHAETLPAGERARFLAIFTTPVPDAPGSAESGAEDLDEDEDRDLGPITDDPLLDDIDAFSAAVEKGEYYQGWGWDPDLHAERAWGDESWVGEMDGLFDEAGAAFVAGELDLAREAYGRLLRAFDLEQSGPAFCGPRPPVEMVATDVGEAGARYLRAVYETTPAVERAERLVAEVEALDTTCPGLTLRSIIDARPGELADLEGFLGGWVGRLGEVPVTGWGWGATAARLLTEALEAGGGPDALAEPARRVGEGQPERYRDWLDALRRAGRDGDAGEVAREALRVLEPYGEVRAGIAQRLVRLVAGDPPAVLEARRAAWRAAPNRRRLLDLVDTATALGVADATLAEEVLAARPPAARGRRRDPLTADPRLTAELLLLAGQVDDVVALLRGMSPLGWSAQEHPGRVVVPYLLVAACRATEHPAWPDTLLFSQLDSVDNLGYVGWSTASDFEGEARIVRGILRDDLLLSVLLARGLRARRDPPAVTSSWLASAGRAIDARIDAVVGGQHRGAYDATARLVAAQAEAVQLLHGVGAGAALLAGMHARYPRHTAWRGELRRAQSASPLLPEPARR
ncbi:MAG TPA: hypothetical protein VNE21_05545 [Mycobacteriales bacterium]|nr:hypothetical protein [Mycobacteriales bacterium]